MKLKQDLTACSIKGQRFISSSCHIIRPLGFTLIELLIVTGIVAVLGSVLILIIRPAELFKQARDSQRLTEMNAIHGALSFYNSIISQSSSTPYFGTPNKIYLSLYDSSSNCATHISQLPSGHNYSCATQTNYRLTNGNGWIPVPFDDIAFTTGNIFSSLPIDPINIADNGFYYTYVTGGSWAISAPIESEKYSSVALEDGGISDTRYELGTLLSLNNSWLWEFPTTNLVGHWGFEEGSGSTVSDGTGTYNGTWYGSGTHYGIGKVGSYAGQFDNASSDYVKLQSSANTLANGWNEITVMAWIKFNSLSGYQSIFTHWNNDNGRQFSISGFSSDPLSDRPLVKFNANSIVIGADAASFNTGVWYHIAATYKRNDKAYYYINGVRQTNYVVGSENVGDFLLANVNNPVYIGRRDPDASAFYFRGLIDEVAIFSKALTESEIQEIYTYQNY